MEYNCKTCGHASGYHKDMGNYWGSCRIIECDCKQFVWDDDDYERYLLFTGKGKDGR